MAVGESVMGTHDTVSQKINIKHIWTVRHLSVVQDTRVANWLQIRSVIPKYLIYSEIQKKSKNKHLLAGIKILKPTLKSLYAFYAI
jgi:hypothetical protein